MDIQLRNENGELFTVYSMEEAMKRVEKDTSIWKISFKLPTNEMVRLVKSDYGFIYEPLLLNID